MEVLLWRKLFVSRKTPHLLSFDLWLLAILVLGSTLFDRLLLTSLCARQQRCCRGGGHQQQQNIFKYLSGFVQSSVNLTDLQYFQI